ncbi:MAG: F0F1 ATP synthase subunit alpha [bacterium]|nr:F0F1 ATP synthase subunit alpha [bacterium]
MADFEALLASIGEVGYVQLVTHSVTQIEGLPGAVLGEKVIFESGQEGEIVSLGKLLVEVLVLSTSSVRVGTRVARTGHRFAISISKHLLGKTANSLGKIIAGPSTPIPADAELRVVDVHAPGIASRAKINKPLETGIIIVDMMVPVGKGQRELVLGDRKTGKSRLLLEAIVAQSRLGSICVYAAIGKKKQEIRRVEDYFLKEGIRNNVIIVASSSHDSAGEIYLTPYTAMTIAEYFRDQKRDVLLVLDDLSTHAKFYREVSLLGRKFPGRDSYPGDIFYVHSRLLERSGNFQIDGQEVALTCLPVVETTQGDLTGYIQTNVMSMTDGHIYFDSDLYFAGRRPAVNTFVSVTRVGHQTQSKLRREMYQATLDLMTNYLRTQDFVRFGAELGDNSRQVLAMGEKVLTLFNQPMNISIPTNVQTILWGLLWAGLWDGHKLSGLVAAYQSDSVLRNMINSLVINSDTVATLVVNVQSKSDQLLPIINPPEPAVAVPK